MEIQILTPSRQVVTDTAEEIYAYGPKGEFGVLAGHAHFVTSLSTGRLYYEKAGKKHAFLVEGGFMEVFEEKVVVAADHVETFDEIDQASSQARLVELEKQLGADIIEPEQFQKLLTERDRETARLQVLS